MQKSLLSHIASKFITEYENVANSCVAYLLNEYSASKEALKIILGVHDVPTYYITELSTTSNGRPDITGLDNNGNKCIIIEGKFWANLTDNQPINYLKELNVNGRILFLAPEKRISSLKIEIEKRLNGQNDKVILCSWNKLLDLIENENNKNYNNYLSSDLFQIRELCKKMDTEGMAPLSVSDLDPMNGRVIAQFSDVIDECNLIIRKWKHSDFKGTKTTSSKYGYGFYFRAFSFGCFLCIDSYKWFVRENHTPIWLSIFDKIWKKSSKIYHAVNCFDPKNAYDDDYGCDYGIVLKPGMDKNQIVNHIVNKTKEALENLNSMVFDE